MIFFDTETTGLRQNSVIPVGRQPRLVEIYALRTASNNKKEETFYKRLNPGVPINEDATKTHGITNEAVKDCPTFASIYSELCDFFFGERVMIAHNLAYDRDIIAFELRRIDKLLQFPWPTTHICTVESTEHIKGHRLSLSDLHEHLFGIKFDKAHSAEADVQALARCYFECVNRGIIT